MKDLYLSSYLAALVLLFILGFFVSGSAEKILDSPDAGCIVIDEILGVLVTLTAAPAHPLAWLLGLALFRLFDITKPFPVSWIDRHLHGGIGIMLDDVLAGLYAFLTLQGLWLLGGLLL